METAFSCRLCGAPLTYPGKGVKPKRCAACRSKHELGAFSPGYRDRWCVLCRAGPYVNIAMHFYRSHGIRLSIRKRAALGLSPPEVAAFRRARDEDTKRTRKLHKVALARHRRWTTAATEELLAGGDAIGRLMARWRVSRPVVIRRLWELRAAGYPVPYLLDGPPGMCKNGLHPKEERGRPCRLCRIEANAKYRAARARRCACGATIGLRSTSCRTCANRATTAKRKPRQRDAAGRWTSS